MCSTPASARRVHCVSKAEGDSRQQQQLPHQYQKLTKKAAVVATSMTMQCVQLRQSHCSSRSSAGRTAARMISHSSGCSSTRRMPRKAAP
jgi:hypothetical protein